jgi:hypothetical protein
VAIALNGAVLRDAGGQHAGAATLSGALRDQLCDLGVATSIGGGQVELIDTVSVPEIGEVVGYLAITTNAQGIVGTLGRGEQIGPPPAFARGRRTPGSLHECAP